MVGFHNPACHWQPKSSSTRAARPVGPENIFQSIRFDARAVVCDLHFDVTISHTQSHSQVSILPSIQHLHSIEHQVQQGLFEQ